MKTAVEWLEHQIREYNNLLIKKEWQAIIDQAKEMEKEQIIVAFLDGATDTNAYSDVAEQYYNETFKTK